MTKDIFLAGGCFWGVEQYFALLPGVVGTEVGYANGPDGPEGYEEVCAGSGHVEALRLTYAPAVRPLRFYLRKLFEAFGETGAAPRGDRRPIGLVERGLKNIVDAPCRADVPHRARDIPSQLQTFQRTRPRHQGQASVSDHKISDAVVRFFFHKIYPSREYIYPQTAGKTRGTIEKSTISYC
jgi:hypothetical protein